MLDYESIKAMAKTIKRPITDLLALSQQNDPFYAGVGARRRAAEWFAEIWSEHGGAGSHLRRVHYRLISSSALTYKPNGEAYQNTENDWQLLSSASLSARYLDLVPFDGLIDRRNDEPMVFAHDLDVDRDVDPCADCTMDDSAPTVVVPFAPHMPPLPSYDLSFDDPVQDYIVEVWIEKSTQKDWLVPLCRRRGVNLVVGIGEQSEIRARQLAMRASEYSAPVRIIYLSDFDPGGRSMPKAVARKVEFTIAKHELDVDLQLIPLVLMPDQCRQYLLPRTPIKETERRKDKFERIFGVGATELDALEAIHPGEMARLLESEFDNWLDVDLDDRARQLCSELETHLAVIQRNVSDRYAGEITSLRQDFASIVDEIRALGTKFKEWEDKARPVWERIASDLDDQRPDFCDVIIPRSEAPGETDRFVLFDSTRDYFTQMDAYNTWRDGEDSNGEDTP